MSENKIQARIVAVKDLSSSLYIISLERKGLDFIPGQHITLGIPGEDKSRLYSIASGTTDQHLEILIREIKNGDLSVRLRKIEVGSIVEITKPVGYFALPDDLNNKKIICVATGSGIAPFRCFSKSHPAFNFTIIHGIKNLEDAIKSEFSENCQYISCTSKSKEGDYEGRVTTYIKSIKPAKETYYYLCGNGEMIHEIYTYLKKENISKDQIYYEEYFNN